MRIKFLLIVMGLLFGSSTALSLFSKDTTPESSWSENSTWTDNSSANSSIKKDSIKSKEKAKSISRPQRQGVWSAEDTLQSDLLSTDKRNDADNIYGSPKDSVLVGHQRSLSRVPANTYDRDVIDRQESAYNFAKTSAFVSGFGGWAFMVGSFMVAAGSNSSNSNNNVDLPLALFYIGGGLEIFSTFETVSAIIRGVKLKHMQRNSTVKWSTIYDPQTKRPGVILSAEF